MGYVKRNALGGLKFHSDEALDAHLVAWMRDVADVRVHGTTHERPIDRFESERLALKPVLNHPRYLRVRSFSRIVSSDFRIDVDTNRYSVPHTLMGHTLDETIKAGLLRESVRGRLVAEHTLQPWRHQVIEDPCHVLDFLEGARKSALAGSSGICRPLSHYAAAAGGA